MTIADELKKLEELRWNGTLTDAEFAQAKAALLAQLAPPPAPPAQSSSAEAKLGEHLAAVRYQQELDRIDREWESEREQYMIADKNGNKHIPTPGEGIGAAVVIGGFGLLWTIFTFSLTSSGPKFGPASAMDTLFPLFGLVFAGIGVWQGVSAYHKAEAYEQAHDAYQRRRAAVRPEDFR